jgi:PEP-CTERM motif-containing protein
MRSFLFAGSSLLALFAAGATASADPVKYVNGSSDADLNQGLVPTGFVQGGVMISPDGLFSAQLQNDGNFVVHYGSSIGGAIDWASGNNNCCLGPYGLSSYRGDTKLFNTSNTSFVVYKQNNPTTPLFELAGANGYTGASFLQLNDTGTLSIYPGTNGVATGSAQTTIAKEQAHSLKELDLTDVTYDLSKAVLSNEVPVAGLTVTKTNSTPTEETTNVTLSLTHTDTQTFSWSESHATAVSIQSKIKIAVPGLESETTVGLTDTTTIMNGESTTSGDAILFQVQDQLKVPAFSTYADEIVAIKGTETVPYTFTGTALFDNGQTGIVTGSGMFSGVSTGDFEVETTCVTSPDNCAGVAPVFTPLPSPTVPEPSTWAMMLIGFTGMGLAGYRATRRTAVA